MALKAAFQMDPIQSLNIKGDSTFAIMLEGQKRGIELFYYTPEALSFHNGAPKAWGHTLSVQDEAADYYKLGDLEQAALEEFDLVFLRQDPPFDMHYVTTTHLLERLPPKTLVVNNPTEVRNAPEKLFVLDFPDLIPPTLITRSLDDVRAFRNEYRDIIVKPLYGNGGAGVFRLPEADTNLSALIEMFQTSFREPFIVQQYLADVKNGDKRIILIDGQAKGAINRIPPTGETRSNMHIGGKPTATELTARDLEICERIGPELKKRGLIFTGIDIIGDYLTEINVTSPTGIREIKNLSGIDLAVEIWDALQEKLEPKTSN